MKCDDSNLFFNGWFHRGEPHEREIAEDFPDQYAIQSYLAYLTAGEDIAVGQLEVQRPVYGASGDFDAMLVFEMTAVIEPRLGVFLCEPVFGALPPARQHLAECVTELEEAMGGNLPDLPIYPVLVSVDPEVNAEDCESTSFFHAPARALSRIASRERFTPAAIEHTVRRILAVAHFSDCKAPGSMNHWAVPPWVAGAAEITQVAA